MVCFLSCYSFHRHIPCSLLMQVVVLQLFASLLLMLFYVQLRMLIRMQIPVELLLVPFCTACWPYGTDSWTKGTQHHSQTMTGSYSNVNQSRLWHIASCNSSFNENQSRQLDIVSWFCLICCVQVTPRAARSPEVNPGFNCSCCQSVPSKARRFELRRRISPA